MFPFIVLDLDFNGFNYQLFENPPFVISEKGSNRKVQLGSFGSSDGLLFLDFNSDGCATLPNEIQMPKRSKNSQGAGIDYLKIFDTDDNYLVNKDDLFYSKLSVWVDRDSNHRCTPDEVIKFSSMSITLHLDFETANYSSHNAKFTNVFKFTIEEEGKRDVIGDAAIVVLSKN